MGIVRTGLARMVGATFHGKTEPSARWRVHNVMLPVVSKKGSSFYNVTIFLMETKLEKNSPQAGQWSPASRAAGSSCSSSAHKVGSHQSVG